jgi:hypothetical protein
MQISRRAVLVRGATMFTGLLFVGSAEAATAGVSYRLKAGPHCSCKACHHHASNRLFATRAAADHGRAHPGCTCMIVRSRAVNAVQWRALFGQQRKPRHSHVDRRWASTQRALKQAARAEQALKAHPHPRAHTHA